MFGLFRKRESEEDSFAKLGGFKNAAEMRVALIISARAGSPPTQALYTLNFVIEMHGRPAVEAAASMLRSGEFDKRFGDRSFEQCLGELEKEHPDPALAAMMDSVRKGTLKI